MLSYLLLPFADDFQVFNLFRYLTFRTGGAIITALLVKFTSPGPIFFRQERVGKWGEPFYCYKFRSMNVVS